MANIARPQPTLDTKNGFLNRSGGINRKGTETTQKTVNPTISEVVVGTLAGRVFGIRLNDGHNAVRHTLWPVTNE